MPNIQYQQSTLNPEQKTRLFSQVQQSPHRPSFTWIVSRNNHFFTLDSDLFLAKQTQWVRSLRGTLESSRKVKNSSPKPLSLTRNEQKWKKPPICSTAQIQTFCQDLNTFTMYFSQHSLGLKNILEHEGSYKSTKLELERSSNVIYNSASQQKHERFPPYINTQSSIKICSAIMSS